MNNPRQHFGQFPTIIGNSPWGAVVLTEQEIPGQLHNVRVQGERSTAIQSGGWLKPGYVDLDVKNVECYGLGELYWGMRLYDVRGSIDACYFHDIGHYRSRTYHGTSPGKIEGHAIYANLGGSLSITRCGFERLEGQAIQLVWRAGETVTERPESIQITVSDVIVVDASMNADRGGFAISLFDGMRADSADISNFEIAWTRRFPPFTGSDGATKKSRGAILSQGYNTEISDGVIMASSPDRPAIQIEGGFATIRRVDFRSESGEPLKILFKDGTQGVVEDCTGDFEVLGL